ncbi:MAG: CRISPR-associated endonuclease Cas2 [Spirochaetia bacterium]
MAKKRYGYLSQYEVMWMLVLFDLPVTDVDAQKEANRFRNVLKELGFSMAQYSVYIKMIGGKEYQPRIENALMQYLPKAGYVDIMYITDKQYGEIRHFCGRKQSHAKQKPQQYELF